MTATFGLQAKVISATRALRLLAEIGELDPRNWVDGTIRITDKSRRCRCLIIRTSQRGWVLKQGTNAETVRTIANEADMYRLMAGWDLGVPTPPLIHSNPELGSIILRYVEGTSCAELPQADREEPALAFKIGTTIGSIHAFDHGGMVEERQPPAVLASGRPTLMAFEYYSNAVHQLLRIIQSQRIVLAGLEELATQWEPTSFTHNDIRADNLLLESSSDRIVPIDWEMGGLGDACWDISSPLAERFLTWMRDPRAWATPSATRNRSVRAGLEDLHIYSAMFLQGYRGVHPALPDPATLVRWCAARLVQFALERSNFTATVTPEARQLLQIAANFFDRPERAASIFFGMS